MQKENIVGDNLAQLMSFGDILAYSTYHSSGDMSNDNITRIVIQFNGGRCLAITAKDNCLDIKIFGL